MLQEIHSLRGMIETQLAGLAWSDAERRDPLRGQLLRGLLAAGVSARLGRSLLADLPAGMGSEQGRAHLQAALAQRLPVLDCEDTLMREGGVYALVGPTGVGKTTTTAKLAARCVLRFGSEQLALVTTDNFRMGAIEQLRLYGEILGVPVYAVKDASELDGLLTQLQGKHMVLVDTVGMSQRDRAVTDQIALLAAPRRPVKRLLLLNAASHGDTLQEVVTAYQGCAPGAAHSAGLAGCIFTKLDEALHAGALIDTAITHQLAVHYLCDGQRVPEHLQVARAASLAASLFEGRAGSAVAAPFATALSASLASWQGGVAMDGVDDGMSAGVESAAASVAAGPAPGATQPNWQPTPLLRSLVHDSAELVALATALDSADAGFAATRLAWQQWMQTRELPSPDADQVLNTLTQALHLHAPISPRWQASGPLLCMRSAGQEGSAACTVYLSSGDGLPLAHETHDADNADAADEGHNVQSGSAAARQFMGKDVVRLLDSAPDTAGTRWLAYAPASQRVWVAGQLLPLSRWLKAGSEQGGPVFGPAQPLVYRRQQAWVSVGEAVVLLPSGSSSMADAVPVRCLVRRIVDAQGRALLHSCALASSELTGQAQTLLQWAAWRSQAQAYFKLVAVAAQQLADWPDQPGQTDRNAALRHCLAAQTALTAWHVQSSPDTATWAAPVRRLWAQLAGKPQRSPAPVTGPTLLEGLGRFVLLLDNLGQTTDAPEAPAVVDATAEPLAHA